MQRGKDLTEVDGKEDPKEDPTEVGQKVGLSRNSSPVRPISAALFSRRLLRAIRPNEKLPVHATTDLQRPGPATDVAVPNQFTFALRVDVDLDALEAVRTGQQRGVVRRLFVAFQNEPG